MKNNEIVSAIDIAEFFRYMREARLSFVHALLEECCLLQQRIEIEKLASTVTLVEFAWVDAADAIDTEQQPLAHDAATLMGELTATLDRFGYDRVQLSAAMMDDWKIPSLFVDAVRFYKKPMLSGWDESNRRQRLARLLNLAAFIADIDVATEDEKQASMPSLFEKSEALGLDIEEVTQAMKDASKEWIGWREAQRFSQRSLQSLSG